MNVFGAFFCNIPLEFSPNEMTLIVALIVLILSIVNICFVARRTLGISSFCPGRQNEKGFFSMRIGSAFSHNIQI